MHPAEAGRIEDIPDEELAEVGEEIEQWLDDLAKLREPFPPERIEKLPKPLGKNAWDNQPSQNCSVCNGYHPQVRMIHLDYVGHANTTDRLLSVDPTWNWEPMAYTPEGLPLFSKDGLWIKLTVCGVTRIGFGDGKSVKEVIGDAIRNAAMRFGVALDLWSKVDLHEAINPDTTSAGRDGRAGNREGVGGGQSQRNQGRGSGGKRQDQDDQVHQDADEPRRSNQDALDALSGVCAKHGYSAQYCIDRYFSDHDAHIKDADEDDIFAFADLLIQEATAEPEVGGAAGEQPADADEAGAAGVGAAAQPAQGDADAAESTPAAEAGASGGATGPVHDGSAGAEPGEGDTGVTGEGLGGDRDAAGGSDDVDETAAGFDPETAF